MHFCATGAPVGFIGKMLDTLHHHVDLWVPAICHTSSLAVLNQVVFCGKDGSRSLEEVAS